MEGAINCHMTSLKVPMVTCETEVRCPNLIFEFIVTK